MPSDVIARISQSLEQLVDERTIGQAQSYFKEPIKCHGVGTAVVNQLARTSFREVKDFDKEEIFNLCETLLQTGYNEEAFIACEWAYWVRDRYQPTDIDCFENWIVRYVDNWAKCDTLCNHAVGAFIERYPEYLEELKCWAKSENRWLRRASAVSLIIPARRGKFLNEVFDLADILLLDSDDLVRKGYGWMLKEASKMHLPEVFAYVLRYQAVMPRTALRYAIEKMPEELKRKAMAKP